MDIKNKNDMLNLITADRMASKKTEEDNLESPHTPPDTKSLFPGFEQNLSVFLKENKTADEISKIFCLSIKTIEFYIKKMEIDSRLNK